MKNESDKMARYRSPDYQTSSKSTGLSVQKKFNTDFQDDGHLGFPIRVILATSHLQVTLTLHEVLGQLAFWLRIKKFKTDFQMAARATILDFRSE